MFKQLLLLHQRCLLLHLNPELGVFMSAASAVEKWAWDSLARRCGEHV